MGKRISISSRENYTLNETNLFLDQVVPLFSFLRWGKAIPTGDALSQIYSAIMIKRPKHNYYFYLDAHWMNQFSIINLAYSQDQMY